MEKEQRRPSRDLVRHLDELLESGDHCAAQRRYDQALDLLSSAGNHVVTRHVLTDLAMLALEQRRPRQCAGARAGGLPSGPRCC